MNPRIRGNLTCPCGRFCLQKGVLGLPQIKIKSKLGKRRDKTTFQRREFEKKIFTAVDIFYQSYNSQFFQANQRSLFLQTWSPGNLQFSQKLIPISLSPEEEPPSEPSEDHDDGYIGFQSTSWMSSSIKKFTVQQDG